MAEAEADMAEAGDAGSGPQVEVTSTKVEVTSTKVDDDDDDQGGSSIGPYSAEVVGQMRGPELRRAVRGALTESGKTQTAFAIALGVNPAYLSQWLNQNWYGHTHGRPKVERFIEGRVRAYLRGGALEPVHACMGPPALGGATSSAAATRAVDVLCAAQAATRWQPRLWATSTLGRSRSRRTSSSRAIQSPRRGQNQSSCTTRWSPCNCSQRVCQ